MKDHSHFHTCHVCFIHDTASEHVPSHGLVSALLNSGLFPAPLFSSALLLSVGIAPSLHAFTNAEQPFVHFCEQLRSCVLHALYQQNRGLPPVASTPVSPPRQPANPPPSYLRCCDFPFATFSLSPRLSAVESRPFASSLIFIFIFARGHSQLERPLVWLSRECMHSFLVVPLNVGPCAACLPTSAFPGQVKSVFDAHASSANGRHYSSPRQHLTSRVRVPGLAATLPCYITCLST
ncbi:hypothetical protein F4823DRAFT_259143 [Ustulina deusta]|nr:hypothetical protein F4823DRAFT_259143 [Ustulina deusta]